MVGGIPEMDLLELRSVAHLHVIELDVVLVQLLRCRCVMVGSKMHLELVLHMVDHFEVLELYFFRGVNYVVIVQLLRR